MSHFFQYQFAFMDASLSQVSQKECMAEETKPRMAQVIPFPRSSMKQLLRDMYPLEDIVKRAERLGW